MTRFAMKKRSPASALAATLALAASLAAGCGAARPLTRLEQCRLAHGPRAAVVVGPTLRATVVAVPGSDPGFCDRLQRVEAENAALRARVRQLEQERRAAVTVSAPSPPSAAGP